MRDPVLLEIVKNAYTTVGEEMGIVVAHSAYSTMVKENRGGGGGGIFDAKGQLITGPGLLHSSAVRPTLLEVLKDFPAESMVDGDAFLCNHPYRGGIHANDVMLFKPVFFQGKLAFFTSALMHVADIGGMSAGGLPANATEMYHEGLILPPVKFYDRGTPVEAIARIIEANSRTPEKVMGDLRALLAGTNVGSQRLIELIEKYGYENLRDATDEIIDYAERRIRHDLKQIPDGVYRGSFIIDDDGIEQRPEGFKVQVAVRIKDGSFETDFTGTDRQARGPINSPLAESTAGVVFAMRCFVDPAIPMNEGCYRVLKPIFPEGTLVNPRPPAALNSRMATVMAMMDSILRALSEAQPERAIASSSNIQVYTMNGLEEGGHRVWTFMDPSFGGAGARSIKDGGSVTGDLIFGGAGTTISTESFESEYPVLFQRHELWTDSGGPGKWRGGLGLRREIKILGEGQVTARIADRARFPPPGFQGGKPGRGGQWLVNAGTAEEVQLPAKVTNYHMKAGDTLTTLTSGGGGFGPPWERDPQRVLEDVIEGAVTLESAQRDYGVVIDPAALELDADETQRLRAMMRDGAGRHSNDGARRSNGGCATTNGGARKASRKKS